MSIKEDIKMPLAKKAMTMTELLNKLSDKANKVTVQNISNKLSTQTIKFEEVRKIMEIPSYDIEYKER